MEAFLIFLLVVGGMLLAATMFAVWAIASVVRWIARMATGSSRGRQVAYENVQVCSNLQCLCANPVSARFCRRCGKSLPNLLRVAPDKVA